jgi:hypothetical protein
MLDNQLCPMRYLELLHVSQAFQFVPSRSSTLSIVPIHRFSLSRATVYMPRSASAANRVEPAVPIEGEIAPALLCAGDCEGFGIGIGLSSTWNSDVEVTVIVALFTFRTAT